MFEFINCLSLMLQDTLLCFRQIGSSKQIAQVWFDTRSKINSSLGFFLKFSKHAFHDVIFFGNFSFVIFNFYLSFFVQDSRFVVLMLLLTEFHRRIIDFFLQCFFNILHFANFAVLFIQRILFVNQFFLERRNFSLLRLHFLLKPLNQVINRLDISFHAPLDNSEVAAAWSS